MQDYFIIFFR